MKKWNLSVSDLGSRGVDALKAATSVQACVYGARVIQSSLDIDKVLRVYCKHCFLVRYNMIEISIMWGACKLIYDVPIMST
jgi:hypothetical protein